MLAFWFLLALTYTQPTEERPTDPSKDNEKVLFVLDAVVLGVRVNSCCTHFPATLLDLTLVLANVFPLDDSRDAVKDPE